MKVDPQNHSGLKPGLIGIVEHMVTVDCCLIADELHTHRKGLAREILFLEPAL
jgi:hypothetical protein